MSATLNSKDFTENRILFKKPPVFIHTKLPPGGILVSVTGQQEVKTLTGKLNALFSAKWNDSSNEATGNKKSSRWKKNRKNQGENKLGKNGEISPKKLVDFNLDE